VIQNNYITAEMPLKGKMLKIPTTNKNLLLIAIIAVFIMAVFAVGLLFFRKKDEKPIAYQPANPPLSKTVKQPNKPPVQQPSAKPPTKEKEKIKVKRLAENFAASYYSYTWGDFSNIEGLYDHMTDELKKIKAEKVKKMKKEIENRPQKYFTVWSEVIDSRFNEYNSKRASLNINLKTKEINGASVARETIVFVDANGNIYKGNIDDLVQKTFNRLIKIDLIKVSNEWKVSDIKSIN
jgi:hypothetical protein